MSQPTEVHALDAATDGGITARFRRRMAPLALVVGVLVATVPPASFAKNARTRLTESAERDAALVADAIREVAARQPELWPYNVGKVVDAVARYRAVGVSQITVRACDGRVRIASTELGFDAPEAGDIVARAPIEVGSAVVGYVDVGVDASPERRSLAVWWGTSATLGLVLSWLLFAFPTRVVRRNARRLSRVNAQLNAAQRDLEASNRDLAARVEAARAELREIAAEAVDAQERERARIARDLHDSLGQHLAAQRFALDGLRDGAASDIDRLREINQALFDDLRRAIDDLGPSELERGGLEEAIRATCERFEVRTGVPISARVAVPADVRPALSLALVRVLQESLTNALRHAEPSEIGVQCVVEGETLVLQVRDDGRGWPDDHRDGNGLAGMRTRMQLIGGTLDLRDASSGGAVIRAAAPLRRPTPNAS